MNRNVGKESNERCRQRPNAASPQRFQWSVRGRSPGSEVLFAAFPEHRSSGLVANRTSLPLRGQHRDRALGFRLALTCFPFHPDCVVTTFLGTANRGRMLARLPAAAPAGRRTKLAFHFQCRRFVLDQ